MKFSYEITKTMPEKFMISVRYLPDCTTCTPDETMVIFPKHYFRIEDKAKRARLIHDHIIATAPLSSWINQKKEVEVDPDAGSFSLEGLDEIDPQSNTETSVALSRDPRTTVSARWTDGIRLAREELKNNRDTMTKAELGAHLRSFIENENFDASPKRSVK
jgi:hypothetical protein